MERADGKATGDERLYTCQRIGAGRWERAPMPYQTRRAVRVVHGAATLDVATHRYSASRIYCPGPPRSFSTTCSLEW